MTKAFKTTWIPLIVRLLPIIMGVAVLLGLGIYTVAAPQRYQVSSTITVLKNGQRPSDVAELDSVRRCTRKLTANYRTDVTIQNSLSSQSTHLAYIPKLLLFIPSDSPVINITLTVQDPEDSQQVMPAVQRAINSYLKDCDQSLSFVMTDTKTVSVQPSFDKEKLWIADIALALLTAGVTYIVLRRVRLVQA